jgi:hypothetical protein
MVIFSSKTNQKQGQQGFYDFLELIYFKSAGIDRRPRISENSVKDGPQRPSKH